MNPKPDTITVHCSVTTDGKLLDLAELRRWHTDPPPVGRGFSAIGYHYTINVDGQVERHRGLNEPGAHVKDANTGNVGICLIGTRLFTQRQFDALRRLLDDVILVYDIPPWQIRCHAQFPSAVAQGKTCPNMDPNRLIAWYLGKGHLDKAIQPYLVSGG
jgi:N-acetyl-anhydromuramyl-L-alanine amidase AmpD